MNINLLMLAYSLLVISIIFLAVYFIDTHKGMTRLRSRFSRRFKEIQSIVQQNNQQQAVKVRDIMDQYNQDINISFTDYIRLTLSQSGVKLSFLQFILITFFFTALGFFTSMIFNNTWLSLILPIGFSQILWFFIRYRFYTRQAAYRAATGDVLNQIFNMYKTSDNTILSIRNSIPFMDSPYRELFSNFLERLRNNVPFAQAVDEMSRDVIDPNFKLFCSIIKVNRKMGTNVQQEFESIKGIYEDEREIRYQLTNEMQSQKVESIILAILAVGILVGCFLFFPSDFLRLIEVPWINTLFTAVVTMIIVGILMLPRILMLDIE